MYISGWIRTYLAAKNLGQVCVLPCHVTSRRVDINRAEAFVCQAR